MRRLAITFMTILFAGAALAASAADDKPPRKSRRPKSSSKVITNEDVKKARGKVTELPPKEQVAPEEPTASLSERHETLKRTRAAAEERVRITAAEVESLKTELARLERSYFDADDLDLRDSTITRRFDEVRAKLAVATAELDTARKALADVAQNP